MFTSMPGNVVYFRSFGKRVRIQNLISEERKKNQIEIWGYLLLFDTESFASMSAL
jgi:hypothetical protein